MAMRYRLLGSTGIPISEVAFGAGPVSGVMTDPSPDRACIVVAHAIRSGINWFDTAAGYGAGQSETNLGIALKSITPSEPVHVATKVRLVTNDQADLRTQVVNSFRASLQRLQLPRATLLQIHNSITRNRDDEPTSITPDDVLGPRGILDALEDLRSRGFVDHFGLTGIGQPEPLRDVIRSGRFATIQAPFHLLNPTALVPSTLPSAKPDYGGFLRDAAKVGMGIMAIRVFAGGALLDAPPSAHTLKTPFFPLDLYERDRTVAVKIATQLGRDVPMSQWALKYVLSHTEVATAILGLATPHEIDAAVSVSERGPLTETERHQLSLALVAQTA
jgi:aryl-alcohol dehydrogenase-like predicted oxidoreductase